MNLLKGCLALFLFCSVVVGFEGKVVSVADGDALTLMPSPIATFREIATTDIGDYYAPAQGLTGIELRASLHAIIDDHTRFPYTSSSTNCWDILNDADEDPNNTANILDLYKNASYAKISGGIGVYNREHTWPKSYGFPDDGSGNYPYTDCHHLMACDASYNSSRSNLPYDFGNATDMEKPTDQNNGQGGETSTYSGNSNWRDGSEATGRWETWIGKRGDVARALFYMDVRYEGGVHGVTGHIEPDLILTDNRALIASSSTGDNETTGYMGCLSTLLYWHLQDPIDDLERERNDVIESYQGNRNPFVDHPEWVQEIFMPAVQIKKAEGDDFRVRWDFSELAELTLMTTTNLLGTNSWNPVINTVQEDAEGRYVELPMGDDPGSFFKLEL